MNHLNDVQEPGSFHHKDQDNNDADDAVDGDNDTDHDDDDDMGALGWWCIHWGDWLACIGGYSEAKKDTSHDDVHHDDHCNYDY